MSENWNDIDQILSDFKKQKQEKEQQDIIDNQREKEALDRAKKLMEEEKRAKELAKKEAEEKARELERLKELQKQAEEKKKKDAEIKRAEEEKLRLAEEKKRKQEKKADAELIKTENRERREEKKEQRLADKKENEQAKANEKKLKEAEKKRKEAEKKANALKKELEKPTKSIKSTDNVDEKGEKELEPPKKRKELIDFSKDSVDAKARSESNKRIKKKQVTSILHSVKKIVLNKYVLLALFLVVLIIVGGNGIKGYVEYQKTSYLVPYQEKYPEVEFPDGIMEEYCDALGQNPDLKGVLKIESMGIDMDIDSTTLYPIADGASYYNFVIKLDNPEFEKRYSTIDGYNSADKGIFFTDLKRNYTFEVVGAFYTNTKPEDDNGYVFPYNTTEKMSFDSTNQFIDRINSRLLYDVKALDIERQNTLLTIECPTDYKDGYKFVVICKEVEEVDNTVTATPKDKVHLTASEYENEEDNPYRFSGQWYPEIIITSPDGVENTFQKTINDYIN